MHCKKLIPLILFTLTFTGFSPAEGDPPAVLFLSSYHPGFPTFYRQLEGVREILDGPEYRLDVEFMDSKRVFDDIHWENLRRTLAHKIAKRGVRYSGVVTADDNALRFALENRNELFPGARISFCGVNDRDLARRATGMSAVAGVIEAVSMEETLRLVTRLHPEVDTVVALTDGTPSGQGDLESFIQYRGRIPGLVLESYSLHEHSYEEMEGYLAGLSENRAVLLLSAYRDSEGVSLDFYESLTRITGSLYRPLYHLWYHGMGEGVLGGKLVSQREQALAAARIMHRRLSAGAAGAEGAAKAGSLVMASPNPYVFDYRELRRFSVPLKALPAGSRILFEPNSFLSEYFREVVAVSFALGIQLLLLLLLLRALRRQRRLKASLAETERRFQDIYDKAPVALWEADFSMVRAYLRQQDLTPRRILQEFKYRDIQKLVDMSRINMMNSRSIELFGISPERDRAAIISDLITEENYRFFLEILLRLLRGDSFVAVALPLIGSEGTPFQSRVNLSIPAGRGSGWERIIIAVEDISDLTKVQQELRDRLAERELLIQELHHRVKNNLAVVVSLLGLQINKIEDPGVQYILKRSQARVFTLALIHESLYEEGHIGHLAFQPYARRLLGYLENLYAHDGQMEWQLRGDNPELDPEQLTSLGLIIAEAVTALAESLLSAESVRRIEVSYRCCREEKKELIIRASTEGTGWSLQDSGLTSVLLQAHTERLGGELAVSTEAGIVISLVYP